MDAEAKAAAKGAAAAAPPPTAGEEEGLDEEDKVLLEMAELKEKMDKQRYVHTALFQACFRYCCRNLYQAWYFVVLAVTTSLHSGHDAGLSLFSRNHGIATTPRCCRKKERRRRHELKLKARMRAAQLAQAEGIADVGTEEGLFSLATIKVCVDHGVDHDVDHDVVMDTNC